MLRNITALWLHMQLETVSIFFKFTLTLSVTNKNSRSQATTAATIWLSALVHERTLYLKPAIVYVPFEHSNVLEMVCQQENTFFFCS